MIRLKLLLRILEAPYSRVISPYFIKEYNNRWFLFGHQHAMKKDGYEGMTNVPLDRIKSMTDSLKSYIAHDEMDYKSYFNDVIGVTVPANELVKIKFKVYGNRRHYVDTKKMHRSQRTIEMTGDYGTFSIRVKPNKEMYSLLLGFGGDLEVMEPAEVRDQLCRQISEMGRRYEG